MGEKIVFIVGAGASAEFGLPTGATLANGISTLARGIKADSFGRQSIGNHDLFLAARQVCKEQGCDPNDFIQQFEKISSGVVLTPSIDNYLHAHSDNLLRVRLGKLLLAYCLLDAEKRSSLFFEPENINSKFDFLKVSNTWVAALFRVLVTAGKIDDLAEYLDRIVFVSFNYDRVIHRFVFLALQSLFDLTEQAAGEFCNEHLNIQHPYGSLGELRGANRWSGFGEKSDSSALVDASNSIKVFTEGGVHTVRQGIRQDILESHSVWFLGFSFLGLNMDYLKPGQVSPFKVFGTTRGMSDFNTEIAKKKIASWNNAGQHTETLFNLRGVNCVQLINDFSGYFNEIGRC